MFTQLKFKLTFIFTIIVGCIKLIFGLVYMSFEYQHGILHAAMVPNQLRIMLFEISITSLITFVIGYFFIDSILKTVEDMFHRLEQFTQDASHELRTPLGIANSSLDLAAKTKNYDQYIPEAKKYVKKASNLVEKMLEMARLDKNSLNLQEIAAEKVISRVIETYQPLLQEKKITLSSSGSKQLNCDVILFERCVSNLLENAIRYNIPEGSIEITLSAKKMSITNTGPVIEAENLRLIFQRYFKTQISRSDKGYGIGLALVKHICDLHNWKICAESSEEKTSFTIIFESNPALALLPGSRD
jgi:signal transduction histidine kinase